MSNHYTAVPHSYLDECEDLTDEEFGRLMRALLRFSISGEPMTLSGNERYFAKRMMRQEEINNGKYAEISALRSEAGRRGAVKRWQTHVLRSGAMAPDGKNGSTDTETETGTDTEFFTGE